MAQIELGHLQIHQECGEFQLNTQEIGNYLEVIFIESRNLNMKNSAGQTIKGMLFTVEISHSRMHHPGKREKASLLVTRPATIMAMLRLIGRVQVQRLRPIRMAVTSGDGKTEKRHWYDVAINGRVPGTSFKEVCNN